MIIDDLGYTWHYNAATGRIMLDGDDSEPADERGYDCESADEGRKLLEEYGYITPETVNIMSNTKYN